MKYIVSVDRIEFSGDTRGVSAYDYEMIMERFGPRADQGYREYQGTFKAAVVDNVEDAVPILAKDLEETFGFIRSFADNCTFYVAYSEIDENGRVWTNSSSARVFGFPVRQPEAKTRKEAKDA